MYCLKQWWSHRFNAVGKVCLSRCRSVFQVTLHVLSQDRQWQKHTLYTLNTFAYPVYSSTPCIPLYTIVYPVYPCIPYRSWLVTTGWGLGTMILGSTLHEALENASCWRNNFRLFAGLLALVSLTGWALRQETTTPGESNKASLKKFRLNLSLLRKADVCVFLMTVGIFTFSRLLSMFIWGVL